MCLTDCDSVITAYSGVFSSPNYPGFYGKHLNCSWLINLVNGSGVRLSINNFMTEANYQFLQVYDGNSSSSPLLLNISGAVGNYPAFVSSSKNMLVLFSTKNGVQFKGFTASFYGMFHHTYLHYTK